jgi:hypothetical protein
MQTSPSKKTVKMVAVKILLLMLASFAFMWSPVMNRNVLTQTIPAESFSSFHWQLEMDKSLN